jgi:hypothetical protein
MAQASAIYVGDNTHIVEVLELEDNLGEPELNATVEMTALVDVATSEAVTGVTLPLALAHVSGGNYQGIIDPGMDIVAGRKYAATISAVGSQDFHAEWTEILLAQVRKG